MARLPHLRPTLYRDGDLRLSYSLRGAGPPVILIHGLSGSRRWWRYNLPALSAGHAVYTVELAGFGYARQQRPQDPRASAALIARWMAALDLPPASVVGHSMGGHVALHLAADHPERVHKLVLACASGLLRAQWWRLALRLPRAALVGRPSFMPVIATDALRAGWRTLYRATRGLLSDDAQLVLPRVQAPTLVVWGGRDLIVPPALGQALAGGIAGAQLRVIERAGHVVMVDAADEFNRAVLAFIDGPGRAPDAGAA